jgi:hypothetical protein
MIRWLAWLGIIVFMVPALTHKLPQPMRILSAVLVVILLVIGLRSQPGTRVR